MNKTIQDGDIFEVDGVYFRLSVERDDHFGPPWKEHDGHGVVSDWTTRSKKPGERVLNDDRGSKRYYDVQESIKIATRDSWGCPHCRIVDGVRSEGHKTRREAIACAVDADFENLRAWCADEWYWVGVVVTLLNEDYGETETTESVWGISSEDEQHISDTARELAAEIADKVNREMRSAVEMLD